MNDFHDLLNKTVELEISGGTYKIGILLDSGNDIIVIYDCKTHHFLYIPTVHIQRLKETSYDDDSYGLPPAEKPLELEDSAISFRKTLMNARGKFLQLYVTGNKSIHGYLTSVLNDYFVFYSPVYKTLFISMHHVKWLIPYIDNVTPYALSNHSLPVNPTSIPLARTFEEQCKKLENQMVILDGGDDAEKIGLLQKVRNNKLTLVTAERETIYRNLEHIKMIHLP
jgi:hypothetical protein